MNDFTREELIEILDYCDAWKPPGLGMSNFRMNTWTKIQSMIDNYCEHDGEIGKDYPAEKCMKCGAYWK